MSHTERDKKYIWHPLTQHKTALQNVVIKCAKGSYLYDENRKAYFDGIASWYTSVYGHCHPHIVARVKRQVAQLDQIVFSGLTHPPAIELSEKLITILPSNQKKIFFSDNGSTAVEVALKMALQFHFNKGEKKTTFIAFENGFHGDTFGAMSTSGLSVYNGPFEELFIDVERVALPNGENNEDVLRVFKKIISKKRVAGFIYEPLLQGAAGMKCYDKDGLSALLKLCRQMNILAIADEVMTGFGKTGSNFASDQIPVQADIICLSKALTAGLLPMAITTCTSQIFEAFYSDDISKGFFHGHTYTANPLACSVALAGIELLLSDEIIQNRKAINKLNSAFISAIKNSKKVKNGRVCGVVVAFELYEDFQRYGSRRNELYLQFLKKGVFLRPLGNTIYVHPPYISQKQELEKVYSTIIEVCGL
ncbi:adenosylmethionine-8-amino-7-oxononanoate aminotransferase [Elysia marginata]|uniref:Adenosylmethionine-8-amino-7-oxononanoate aminotransferase n=1 Tax=Elysia marginata TaxID=1093978 RepID=A0AAV4FQE0_9GAST|nr:adenosylmethionine-8-amino-7-oxononanoate aminotransferase [Elysia marginata]